MLISRLATISRPTKRLMFLAADLSSIVICLYAAFALRYGMLAPPGVIETSWPLFAVMICVGAVLIISCDLHRIKLQALENRAILNIGIVSAGLVLASMATSYLLQYPAPRSVPLIFGALFFLMAVALRVVALHLLSWLIDRGRDREPVAIYGAGAAGIQLAAALRQSAETRPVVFIDDNPNLHGLVVAGLRVAAPDAMQTLLHRHGIRRVLLAMPSVPQDRQDILISEISAHDVDVQILPSYVDMMAGRGLVDALRTVTPDELLGRDKVALDVPEIAKAYAGRVVMVTGAGGSIGSELCRQLLDCSPARIVLFEQGEFALYSIDRELRPLAARVGIPVVTRLGSVTNRARVAGVVGEEGVEIILHAAAYKHVPLVEENELEGARNNVLGTQIVADVAREAEVERFILVSTDKAVRPTNIMGATKRMAELVVQDLHTRSLGTKFAMVRFGNVLGSSGSVLPLFETQIKQGGPVTVTHPDVTRFFMTIPEAARLVLLAGAFAKGGDVFVLDMGQPQKIMDIAHKMIRLSGRTVLDPATGIGDIEIQISGLRPGEKLYEELLIDDDSLVPTPHAKIMRAEEAILSQIEVAAMLRELHLSINEADTQRLLRLLEARVDGFNRQVQPTG